MKTQKIDGVNHKGWKRVANRILAGYWAWSLCSDGTSTLGPNPTTSTGRGIVTLHGMTRVVEGIRRYLSEKGETRSIYLEKESAEKNAWNLIWSQSMPVLHLAIPLYLLISHLLIRDSVERLRAHAENLILSPYWIVRALADAEYWRVKLPGRIQLFDPDKVVCIRPKEY